VSDDETLIRIPTDVKLNEEILGDPAPRVITDVIPPKKGVPVILWGIIFLIGLVNFIISPYWASDASDSLAGLESWMFYSFLLMLMPYLLRYIKNKINFCIEQEHRIKNISREDHLKLKKRIFGPVSIVVVLLLTIVFVIYDLTGYELTTPIKYVLPIIPSNTLPEGWISDVIKNWSSNQAFYVNYFQAGLFLVVWEVSWLFNAQFLWFVIGFLWYLGPVVRKHDYREPVEVVIKMGLTKPVLHSIVEVGWGYIPYLVFKFIYQLINIKDIWFDDTISTTLVLVFFLVISIVPPMEIANRVKSAHAEAMHHAEVLGTDALENVVKKAETTGVPIAEAVTALLLNTYLHEMKQKQGGVAGGVEKKIVTSAAGPIGSYGAKEGLALYEG